MEGKMGGIDTAHSRMLPPWGALETQQTKPYLPGQPLQTEFWSPGMGGPLLGGPSPFPSS